MLQLLAASCYSFAYPVIMVGGKDLEGYQTAVGEASGRLVTADFNTVWHKTMEHQVSDDILYDCRNLSNNEFVHKYLPILDHNLQTIPAEDLGLADLWDSTTKRWKYSASTMKVALFARTAFLAYRTKYQCYGDDKLLGMVRFCKALWPWQYFRAIYKSKYGLTQVSEGVDSFFSEVIPETGQMIIQGATFLKHYFIIVSVDGHNVIMPFRPERDVVAKMFLSAKPVDSLGKLAIKVAALQKFCVASKRLHGLCSEIIQRIGVEFGTFNLNLQHEQDIVHIIKKSGGLPGLEGVDLDNPPAFFLVDPVQLDMPYEELLQFYALSSRRGGDILSSAATYKKYHLLSSLP